jgi:hypothetical protein
MRTPNQINEEIYDTFGPHGFDFPKEPEHQDLVVGPDVVMQSAAGYYVGQWCFEYLDDDLYNGEWCGPMPYARDTEYMSKEHAEEWLQMYGEG